MNLGFQKKNQFLDCFKKGIDKEGILCSIIGAWGREDGIPPACEDLWLHPGEAAGAFHHSHVFPCPL